MRPDITQTILREIDDAIAAHSDWLQRWHRAVVCGLDPDHEVAADDAHLRCRFGAWYELNRGRGLVEQPAFESLHHAHREKHDYGRVLAPKASRGRRVEAGEYDSMVEKVGLFNDLARPWAA